MNKFNFVRDGESKLPPGFRFQPTDEEMVFQYLAPKTFSHPLPAYVIPEINSTNFDPWELPTAGDDRYFFCNEMRGSGWKWTGLEKQIRCSKRRMPIVGMKKTFLFYKAKTHWCMHLFCIALLPPYSNIHHKGTFIRIGKWILCHIFSKRSTVIKQRINFDRFVRKESSETDSSSSMSSASSSDSNSSVFSEVSSGSA